MVTDAHALDYADKILPNMARYYICRRRDCAGIFKNIDWITTDAAIVTALHTDEDIKESGGYQFRCPLCGEQHRQNYPASDTLIGANQVFTFTSASGTQRCILAEIPSAMEAGLLAAFTEATHNLTYDSLKDMSRENS